jgi:hypothetical protein
MYSFCRNSVIDNVEEYTREGVIAENGAHKSCQSAESSKAALILRDISSAREHRRHQLMQGSLRRTRAETDSAQFPQREIDPLWADAESHKQAGSTLHCLIWMAA